MANPGEPSPTPQVQTLTLETFRALFETVPDAIVVVDGGGVIVMVNSHTERLLGYARHELVGQPIDAVIPALQALQRTRVDRSVNAHARSGVALYARHKDGSERPVDISLNVLTTEQGTLFCSVIRDQTAPTEVEQRHRLIVETLRQSQRHLVASQHVARVGSWELDLGPDGEPQNTMGRWSDECYRVFGYEPGEVPLTRDAFWARVHPEDRPNVQKALRATIESRIPFALDHRIVLDDGSERIIHEQAELVLDDVTFRPVRLIGTAQDITSRVHLEAQLRQSQKMQAIGQLAGGVAHDFNNLLTVINGHSEMLLMERSDPEDPIRRELEAIRDAGERATHLTRQLLLFSRKAVLEPSVLDCNALVRNTIEMLRRLIGEDVSVATVLAPSLYRIRADASQMEQVVMNLSLNARDAMAHGGTLTIETHKVGFDAEYCQLHPDHKIGHFVQLVVSDTGCGMTPNVRAHLFEPFFTTKGPGKGTGLGLATVYGIVQESGGFITVATEVDAGTTFNVFLPALADDAPLSRSTRTDRGHLAGRETVLLVEDEEGVRHIAKVTLEMYGYTVIEAASGADAIRLVESREIPVQLLLTDVMMPGMSGRQLADAVRLFYPDCRVVFMSGYNEDAVVHSGLDHTTHAFLQKPFTPLVLARKLRDVLDQVL
jgi:two-component system, cell cycle sensor histidine kinase and response regulator CckA